jgi:hypothetical protein
VSTLGALKQYESDLKKWKAKTKKGESIAEPSLNSGDEFARKVSLQIRAKVLAEPNTKL